MAPGSEDYNIISGEDGEAKNPSIDFEGNIIKIVFEIYEPLTYPDAAIFLVTMEPDENGIYQMSDWEDVLEYASSYFGQAKPVIVYTDIAVLLIYRKNSTGGIYQITKWNNSGNWQWGTEGFITNTFYYSYNPTICGTGGDIQLAYQQSSSVIKYIRAYNQSTNWIFTDENTISTGDGYSSNYRPSISLMGNGYPIISWTGSRLESQEEDNLGKGDGAQTYVYRVITRPKSDSWGSFYVTGDGVGFTNNSSSTNQNEETVITFSNIEGTSSKWFKRTGSGYYLVNNLSHTGKQVQVCGANGLSNIKALVFNTSISPYPLNRSTTSFTDFLGKITSDSLPTFGRTGVVYKEGVEFVFFLGDILSNNENVKFIERSDTLAVTDVAELNNSMKTNSFFLNSNSDLIFSVNYYVINSEIADSLLTENDEVSFRVELVNTENNEVVGTFDEVEYDLNNLEEHNNKDYQVDCSGITNGSYFFRLVTGVEGNAQLYLSNLQNENWMLQKKNYQAVKFDEVTLPKEYSIEQNYPNPFNPSTTIKYEIPKDGIVTLKIYDILGAEVATLVNEEKSVGRYEINFDASKLASGVYIYQLRVNDFSGSKKMILLR